MNPIQTMSLSPDVISREVCGTTILPDFACERYFGRDEVGTRTWQLIRETNNNNVQKSDPTLLADYEALADRLQRELENLLSAISMLGLHCLEQRS